MEEGRLPGKTYILRAARIIKDPVTQQPSIEPLDLSCSEDKRWSCPVTRTVDLDAGELRNVTTTGEHNAHPLPHRARRVDEEVRIRAAFFGAETPRRHSLRRHK